MASWPVDSPELALDSGCLPSERRKVRRTSGYVTIFVFAPSRTHNVPKRGYQGCRSAFPGAEGPEEPVLGLTRLEEEDVSDASLADHSSYARSPRLIRSIAARVSSCYSLPAIYANATINLTSPDDHRFAHFPQLRASGLSHHVRNLIAMVQVKHTDSDDHTPHEQGSVVVAYEQAAHAIRAYCPDGILRLCPLLQRLFLDCAHSTPTFIRTVLDALLPIERAIHDGVSKVGLDILLIGDDFEQIDLDTGFATRIPRFSVLHLAQYRVGLNSLMPLSAGSILTKLTIEDLILPESDYARRDGGQLQGKSLLLPALRILRCVSRSEDTFFDSLNTHAALVAAMETPKLTSLAYTKDDFDSDARSFGDMDEHWMDVLNELYSDCILPTACPLLRDVVFFDLEGSVTHGRGKPSLSFGDW